LFIKKIGAYMFLFYIWLIIAFLFLLMEMLSPGLFFFTSFFCGALLSAVSTFFSFSFIIQGCVFFIGTIIALWLLRFYIVPLIGLKRHSERTNVYALIGKKGIVTQRITTIVPGLVKINGAVWVAKCFNVEVIEEGIMVEVIDVRGAHLMVKTIQKD